MLGMASKIHPHQTASYNQDACDALRAFTLYLSAASGWNDGLKTAVGM